MAFALVGRAVLGFAFVRCSLWFAVMVVGLRYSFFDVLFYFLEIWVNLGWGVLRS